MALYVGEPTKIALRLWAAANTMARAATSGLYNFPTGFGLRVRPAQNPQNQKEDIAHFYAPESTSSFTVAREGKKVTAAIYDRNTKENKGADSITDKIRDAVIGVAGKLGFSKIQWKSLTDGLIKKDE